MRILHAVECDGAGGVASVLKTYCAAQQAAGHEVHVLAPHDPREGVSWHAWHIDRGHPTSWGRAGRELAATVRACRPDVVHLHSFFAGMVGRAALPRRGAARPVVVYQPHSWAYQAVGGRAPELAVTAIEVLLGRRTSHLICNCADELDEGRRHGVSSPGSAVGVPVDTRAYCPAGATVRPALRRRLACRDRVVLCVGRISHQKGQDRLVSEWVRNPVPGAELVLVGGGDVEPLRRLAGEAWGRSVRWVGHQNDVRPWLRMADVLVVPSRYEGQSVAVAEALACGLPVVAGAVNGAVDAIVRGPRPAAGAVAAEGDLVALVSECRRRVLDDRLREREAAAARQRACALFDQAAVSAEVEHVYRLAQSRARAGAGPAGLGAARPRPPEGPRP
jgi:glycosyltransferase involved in cell wall biosynthesis